MSNPFMPRHWLRNWCHTHTLAPHRLANRCAYPSTMGLHTHHTPPPSSPKCATTAHHLHPLPPPPHPSTSCSSPSMDVLNNHTHTHTHTLCPKVTPSLTSHKDLRSPCCQTTFTMTHSGVANFKWSLKMHNGVEGASGISIRNLAGGKGIMAGFFAWEMR